MTAPYTPTTEAVRHEYSIRYSDSANIHEGEAEFDRWLAQVKAQALREAAEEARVRGDIGHPEGVSAEHWLTVRAGLIDGSLPIREVIDRNNATFLEQIDPQG